MNKLKSYGLAVELYKLGKKINLPTHLKDQWLRASSSIALNISEGQGKITRKDQAKYFSIALGSLRECQAILDLDDVKNEKLTDLTDHLGGCLYKLIHR